MYIRYIRYTGIRNSMVACVRHLGAIVYDNYIEEHPFFDRVILCTCYRLFNRLFTYIYTPMYIYVCHQTTNYEPNSFPFLY